MIKTWKDKFAGKSVVFQCDNEAVVTVINSGRARNPELLQWLRELVFLAVGIFEFRAVHLEGRKNILPDLLSRWEEGDWVCNKFFELTKDKGFKELNVAPSVCSFTHNW